MAEAVRRWGQDYSYTVFGCKNWRLELPIRNLKSRIPAFGCSWHSRAAFQTNSESPPARLHLLSCDTKGFHSVLVGIGSRVPVRTEQETERAREERRGGEEHGATRPGGGDDAEFPEELVPREAYWRSMAEANGKKGSRGYLTWTPDMDTALLAVLVERHNNGDHAQNGWKPHVYNACIRHVKDTCGVDITKDNMTARCKTFDKHYEVISKILAQSGFGWDWENNKLSIDSEDVWSKYVEANKATGSYKTKVVMNWDQISTIYSKDHATGEGAKTAVECVQEEDTQVLEESPDIPQNQKRLRTGDAILCMMGDMKAEFQEVLKTTDPLTLPKVTPSAEILAALQIIPDLVECDMLKAYEKLSLGERLFESLMELPMTLRKAWLLSLA